MIILLEVTRYFLMEICFLVFISIVEVGKGEFIKKGTKLLQLTGSLPSL